MIKKNANLTLPDLSFLDSYCNDNGLDQFVKDKLSLNLIRIWRGNNEIYSSPFAKEMSDKELFKVFDSEVLTPNFDKMNSVLINMESDQRKKSGPISIALPWLEWRDTFLDTFKPKVSSTNVKGISYKSRLRPISIDTALKKLRRSTSSSLPYMKRKGDVLDKVKEDFTEDLAFKYPSVLYTRTQENKKIRGVWGYPIFTTLLEATYFYPILEVRRQLKWRSSLIGPDSTSKNVTRLINLAKAEGKMCLSIDIERFDSSTSPVISKLAFDNLSTYFQESYRDTFKRISDYFVSIGVVTPDGILYGEHGVGSGSNFTNEIDSEIQMMIALDSNALNNDYLDVQGDDGAYVIDEMKISSLKNNFKKNGYSVSDEKSYISSNYFIYLQKLFHDDYRDELGVVNGIYPITRALNKIRYQENWSQFEDREISGQDFYSLRTISILENCKYHPLFEDFVKFVIKYDKYSLAYSKNGLAKYVRMLNETEGNRGEYSNQYGDNIEGINSFRTVQLIRQLSS